MGYSHYFSDLVVDEKLAEAARTIVSTTDIQICGGIGEGEPVIDKNRIWLNGCEENEEDYETFSLSTIPEEHGGFCKTGDAPYDEVVTAILTAALRYKTQGWESIGSDGDIYDWADGIFLYAQATGDYDDTVIRDVLSAVGDRFPYLLPQTQYPENFTDLAWGRHRKTLLAACSFIADRAEDSLNVKIEENDFNDFADIFFAGKKDLYDLNDKYAGLAKWEKAQKSIYPMMMIWREILEQAKSVYSDLDQVKGEAAFERLRDCAERYNVTSAVKALDEGVPAEDIVA